MSTQQNKELVQRQFDEMWNGDKWDALDEMFAPELRQPRSLQR
jgi:ketosteroid isomerase-like protein